MTVAGMPPSHPCMVGYTAVWYPARRNHDLNRRIMGSPEVSEVTVAEILARCLRDSAFAARLRADAEHELAALDLTDAERATILAGLRGSGGGQRLDQRPRIAGRIV
jgi:hypothetical protein